MIISMKLLPMKMFYFFALLGSAPITPYIPIIGKGLGFSSVDVGWIYTVAPVLTILLKPLIGSFADKYSCQKTMFIILIILQAFGLFSIKWIPPVPTGNPVTVNCSDGMRISTCSDKLRDDSYSKIILQNFNSSVSCELFVPQINLISQGNHSSSLSEGNTEHIPIRLHNGTVENECISIRSNLTDSPLICKGRRSLNAELNCDNEAINGLTKKPKIDESEIMFTYQYWVFFIVIIVLKIIQSVGMSFGDTICFSLLGNHPENYGAQRMWGSVGWGLMSASAGYLVDRMSEGKAEKDYNISFYLCLCILLFNALVSSFIKVNLKKKSPNIMKDVKQLFYSAKTNIFILWCIVSGMYIAFVWNYLFWFIEDLAEKSGNGGDAWIKTLEGLVLAVHCIGGEIPVFFMSGPILRRIGYHNAMRLVLFTLGLIFLYYSSLSNPWWILLIESLNGITFGIFHSTMTSYASSISPPGTETTVQNLVSGLFEGVGLSFGGLIGGYLLKAIGSSRTFLMNGLSAIVFGIILIIVQRIFKNDETVYYRGAKAG